MPDAKLYVSAAFLCEKALQDKDGSLSAIRIVDTYFINIPKDIPSDVIPALELTLLVSLKKASLSPVPESHEVSLRLHAPSGEFAPLSTTKFPVVLTEIGSGHNLIMNLRLPGREFGLFWFDVNVDGELVTRIPFKLLPQNQSSPISTH